MRNKTKLIGILNLTTDSFSDAGSYIDISNAKKHIDQMIEQGCTFIDIGAESTKPGFRDIDVSTQIKKIIPIIKYIKSINQEISISIDTRASEVADLCLEHGASIINDVSGSTHDEQMLSVVSKHNAEIILGHLPKEHQKKDLMISSDILFTLTKYFDQLISAAETYGIDNTKIIIDPSICFGKSGADNIKILKNLDYFIKRYNRVCIGVSNKIFSSEVFKDIKDSELDIVSSAVSSFATFSGVEFIRVHKIEPNHDAVEVSWKTYIS
tara:strand:+ start:1015 stop:1818 length:804 start_codon:yes stop_codon:yes gene_type:complete